METDAAENGYYLCPDKELLDDLIDGLSTNEERYGYGSCPCRVAVGSKTYDGDIICPCEYRDADVDEFGMCFCALFVSKEMMDDPSRMSSIPERRPPEVQKAAMEYDGAMEESKIPMHQLKDDIISVKDRKNSIPVWRCEVCGYLCAREYPPPICPICKAKAERFQQFSFG
jgi:ferredoxin-thioredoxin reductase catalytic subunit